MRCREEKGGIGRALKWLFICYHNKTTNTVEAFPKKKVLILCVDDVKSEKRNVLGGGGILMIGYDIKSIK